MPLRRYVILLTCALALILTVKAQCIASPGPTVSLLTCAPGDEVYELEGHSALRIVSTGHDYTVHWGVFDFNAPNFVYRFVKGETDYSIGVIPTEYFLYEYRSTGRRVTEQVLNLTPAQCERVVELVDENLRPENRVYRYNYVKDNCATRPLQLIERAIGEPVMLDSTAANMSVAESFRDVMNRYHRNYPWYQFGIDLALGSGIDYELQTREKAFAPVILCDLAANAFISDTAGVKIPLVRHTEILAEGPEEGIALPATPWWRTPTAAGMLLLLVAFFASLRDVRRRRVNRVFDTLFYGAYGITGCIIAFLVFISVHEATSPNIQLVWLNPLCLVAAAGIWLRSFRGMLSLYHMLNLIAIAVFLCLWVFGPQSMLIAFLPFVLADAMRSANYLIVRREQDK